MLGHQMALEHFHLLAILKADEVVLLDRRPNRHGRIGVRLVLAPGAKPQKRFMDCQDQRRDLLRAYRARFPRGANAADARGLLDSLDGN